VTDAPQRPRLTLVEEALKEVPESRKAVVADVFTRYGPAYARRVRQEERAAIFKAVGAKTIDDIAIIPTLKAELREAFEREEAKHVRAHFWRGMAFGGALVFAITLTGAAWYANSIIGPTFDAAAQARLQDQVTEAFVSGQQDPPAPEYGQSP